MAKKKTKNKLPSGNFRVQVFDYKDEDGKKHYKSFTAPTKAEAQYLAAQWKTERTEEQKYSVTLYEAVTQYIDMKRNVLSPSTILGYERMQKNYLKEVGKIRIGLLTNTDLQLLISNLSTDLSPKTVRNVHGLVSATIDMFAPDFQIKVTLPAKKKAELYCPSDDDVSTLLKYIDDPELELAVLLAAFGPMRRGEICALETTDIYGNTLTVSKSIVLGPDHEWIVKQPKTYGSYRDIEFPDFVISKLNHHIKKNNLNGRIILSTPDAISERFTRELSKAGLPHFRFHDLRHYAASIMHAIGIPDQYILQRGGWSSDNVMKSAYRNTIDLETVKQTRKINDHFRKVTG